MQDEIVNKVANSALEVFDLEDFYQAGERVQVDISQWLHEGFLLKEKDFRAALLSHDWTQYQNKYVAVYSSPDIIIPAWATILVTCYLIPFAKKIVFGTTEDLETAIYGEILPKLDYTKFEHKPVILKGCSKKPVPRSAYILAIQFLQPVAKSIMYGEACSAVPLFKKNK
jgi:hypothetical protein